MDTTNEAPDIRSVEADLIVPPMISGQPERGKRVRQTIPEYQETHVYHTLYLPSNWSSDRQYPLLVEFTGNGPYHDKYHDISSGRVEDSKLGFGISAGHNFIWLCLPYLNNLGTANVTQWWGNKPDYHVEPTLDYCKNAVPWVCQKYNGNPNSVIITGFSRGAIACNYIGLNDDKISNLWAAFIPYSHYDGVIETWSYSACDRASALTRLNRLKNRPQFICHEATNNQQIGLNATKCYLDSTGIQAPLTFRETGFRNHNDAWVLRSCPTRKALRHWLKSILTTSLTELPGFEKHQWV